MIKLKYYCYDKTDELFVRCYYERLLCCKTCTENCQFRCGPAKRNERCNQQISEKEAIIILL